MLSLPLKGMNWLEPLNYLRCLSASWMSEILWFRVGLSNCSFLKIISCCRWGWLEVVGILYGSRCSFQIIIISNQQQRYHWERKKQHYATKLRPGGSIMAGVLNIIQHLLNLKNGIQNSLNSQQSSQVEEIRCIRDTPGRVGLRRRMHTQFQAETEEPARASKYPKPHALMILRCITIGKKYELSFITSLTLASLLSERPSKVVRKFVFLTKRHSLLLCSPVHAHVCRQRLAFKIALYDCKQKSAQLFRLPLLLLTVLYNAASMSDYKMIDALAQSSHLVLPSLKLQHPGVPRMLLQAASCFSIAHSKLNMHIYRGSKLTPIFSGFRSLGLLYSIDLH